jgi:uncharacterized protein (DUF4213/DUF364 family)
MIIERLIELALQKAGDTKVKDVRVGLGYSCVEMDDGSCGLAYTFRNELGPCCGLINEAGEITGKSCKEVIQWAKDTNLAMASIGVAAINAILHRDLEHYDKGNFMNKINIKPDESFGMVGYFKPVVQQMKKLAKKLYIFERAAVDSQDTYPDWAIDLYLPKCDVVLITGTAIINKTIDHILEKAKNAREIYIVGPSTTMCPEIFKEYGVTHLAGSIVKDPEQALAIVGQGGGTRAMRNAIEHAIV